MNPLTKLARANVMRSDPQRDTVLCIVCGLVFAVLVVAFTL